SLGRRPGGVLPGDEAAHADTDGGEERLDVDARALGDELDAAVGEVRDVAGHREGAGLLGGAPAEADALHVARGAHGDAFLAHAAILAVWPNQRPPSSPGTRSSSRASASSSSPRRPSPATAT